MEHVNIKIFVEQSTPIHLGDAIPVFHRWIQNNLCPELLIDVVDYAHVPAGPGVMLIGHEADYSLDLSRNRLGLLYNRKATDVGSASEKLTQAYQSALTAAQRLEQEPEFAGKLKFSANEVEIILNDRLLFPNTEETWQSVKADLQAFLDGVFGASSYAVTRATEPRERFRINATKSA